MSEMTGSSGIDGPKKLFIVVEVILKRQFLSVSRVHFAQVKKKRFSVRIQCGIQSVESQP
jgi:hypothetical protein